VEQLKDLGGPLAAIIVVLAVLLKTLVDQGNNGGTRYWRNQDSEVQRETLQRITRLEEQLLNLGKTLGEMRDQLGKSGDVAANQAQTCARHMLDLDTRWRDLEKWQRWVEEELRGKRGPRR